MSARNLPSIISQRDLGLFPGTKPLGKRTRRGRTSSYPGIFASTKCLGIPVFDSLLERDFQTVLCADHRVHDYAVQSHHLMYWTPNQDGTNTQRIYTPDFTVRTRTGTTVVIEVKAEAFISSAYWQKRAPYISAAYEQDHAVKFLVISERQIRIQPQLTNYRLMLRYGARLIDNEAKMVVQDALARAHYQPRIGEICESVSLTGKRMARSYAALLRLALDGIIKLDLDAPLSLSTTILEKPTSD